MEEIDRIGWSEECFDNIDREIMDLQFSRSDIEGKVERYGKKYAWIGYYKAASVLQDAELLNNEYYKWRVPEVNYDCTFPQFGVNVQLDIPELLSPKDIDNARWMKIPFSKDLCQGITERLFEDEEFICIYAGYSEKDETKQRKTVVCLT